MNETAKGHEQGNEGRKFAKYFNRLMNYSDSNADCAQDEI